MNIMVFDVPAESGGALSVLNDFYREVTLCKDKNINWIFVVSKPRLEETENIKVLRYPWIKKSWGHRFYFDNLIAPKLIKKHYVDRVFSLQNVIVPHTKSYQILYVHNSLPFVEHKFTLRENKLLWTYQNIIGKSIINSLRKSDEIIVQSNWMKSACMGKAFVDEKKIKVLPPKANFKVTDWFNPDIYSFSTFFYPASGIEFKNHRVVVEACKKLKVKLKDNYKVIFTLRGDENNNIKKLFKEVKENKLPIEFVGNLSREQVFDLYSKSVLLFPSYVESSPLPLTEAKLHHSPILTSDYSFSHEVLDSYKNAYFFNAFNSEELSGWMESFIKLKINYVKRSVDTEKNEQNLIDLVINSINS